MNNTILKINNNQAPNLTANATANATVANKTPVGNVTIPIINATLPRSTSATSPSGHQRHPAETQHHVRGLSGGGLVDAAHQSPIRYLFHPRYR